MQNWTFHTWSGMFLSLLFITFLGCKMLRRRNIRIDRAFLRFDARMNSVMTDRRKELFMAVLIGVGIWVFVKCWLCESGKTLIERGYMSLVYFHLVYRYFMRIFPMLIAGALVAGIIKKYFNYGRIRFPSSILGSEVFASVIPMCSCSAVPVAQSLLLSKKMTLRAVIAFLVVVPVLNPFVIVFGTTVIGWQYTALRIVVTFILGALIGIGLERWIGIREEGPLGREFYSCKGCSKSMKNEVEGSPASFLTLTYHCFFSLLVYMIIGVAVGAAVAKYFPPPLVGKYFSSNTLGLLLATSIGLPLFICSGEEILILKPLLDLGLPLGHAIAFTVAGNGICFASIPLLVPCFGKKATAFITASFFVGSFLAGLLINLLL